MIFYIAIIPSIVLLAYIYKKDTKEKEPMKLLMKLFILGVLLIIPAIIFETIFEAPAEAFATPGSFGYAFYEAFIVAALVEEVCKYIAMREITWKSREFNCMYDGIVYAVFVSLGFATFENLMYVMDGDLSTAVARMLTSIPGHTCFAVYMGFYFSRAKLCHVRGEKKEVKRFKRKALFIPIVLHGIYDYCIMVDESVVGEWSSTIAIIVWIVYICILFKRTFGFVKQASASDFYFDTLE